VSPASSPDPLLHVTIQPRHSIYDSSEHVAHFILDAALSWTHGDPLPYGIPAPIRNHASLGNLEYVVRQGDTLRILASGSVPLNTTGKLVEIDLSLLEPNLTAYPISVAAHAAYGDNIATYAANTELYYLPAKNSGSTVKIDNLYGGMLVANNVTHYAFEPLLPFGFYTSCSGYLNQSSSNVTAYRDLGFNAINPVCAFPDPDIDLIFDSLDDANLWYQYDMRGSYRNLSSVAEQIPLLKDRSNLLSWYTGDEPDGWQYALNSTKLAYDLLKREDPYHPTGLVLNCDNYYFEEYTSGADYIMQDVYPIGIDPHFSRKFNTTCNETYGDCGCDNCDGVIFDVGTRLDSYATYQDWLGLAQKPLWSVLQAFSGEQYWARLPTELESWAMMIVSLNHHATAFMSWLFPTTALLHQGHAAMARVLTRAPVRDFLLGATPTVIMSGADGPVDAAFWFLDGRILLSLVCLQPDVRNQSLTLSLTAVAISRIVDQPWGDLTWQLQGDHTLTAFGVDGLSASLLILDTRPDA
jgi:hypothetical protein